MGSPSDSSTGSADRSVNLSVLLSRLLFQYTCDWEAAEPASVSLLFWSNFLRPVGSAAVRLSEVHRVARVSRRAINPKLKDARWFVVDGDREVRLTGVGVAALRDGARRFDMVDAAWRARFGADSIEALHSAIAALVDAFPVELPHYPMPYGPADERITGGNAIAGREAPVAIPAHGKDWPVVRRNAPCAAAGIPLPAMLSQALVSFAIDYEVRSEAWRSGNSMSVTALLSLLSPDGVDAEAMPATRARKSLELEGLLGVESVPTHPRQKRLVVTRDGVRVQQSNLKRLDDVERDWRKLYGARRIDALRRTARTIVELLEPGLPDQLLVVFVGGRGFIDVTKRLNQARR